MVALGSHSVLKMLRLRPCYILNCLRSQRAITAKAAQLKRQERGALKMTNDFDNSQDMRNSRPPLQGGPASDEVKRATKQIGYLTKSGQFGDAWQLFETLQERGTVEYCVGLHLCAQAGWLDEARALWADMGQDLKNVVAYTAMLKVFANAKRVRDAEQLFDEMQTHAVAPNIITYNTLVSAYGMRSMAEQAKSTFDSIPADVWAEAGDSSRQASYAGVMFAHARVGDYAATRELFMDMTSKQVAPNKTHFNALLTSCTQQGLTETARAIFDMLPHYNIKPECDMWTALISCHRQDLGQCKQILSNMQSAGVQPSGLTYQVLLNAHVHAGDGPGARELVEDMEKFGAWKESYVTQQLAAEAAQLP